MSAAIGTLQDAIKAQKEKLAQVEQDTRAAREAGRVATQEWEREKRVLLELEEGLAAIEASRRGVEVQS